MESLLGKWVSGEPEILTIPTGRGTLVLFSLGCSFLEKHFGFVVTALAVATNSELETFSERLYKHNLCDP